MNRCKLCSSQAINLTAHGRDGTSDPDLCDVCYWRTRAEKYVTAIGKYDSLSIELDERLGKIKEFVANI